MLVPSIPDIETGLKLALAGSISMKIIFLVLVMFFIFIFFNYNFIYALAGSVKDSVVGEERIAQYFLAVLNTRGTPIHWKHLNNRRMEGIRYDPEEKHEYNLKNLKPKRMSPPNKSDVYYIEVTNISL